MHGYVSKGGMGIGLYTAYEMAKLHKGDLSYQRSDNLGGSIFTLTLPTDKNLFEPEDFVTTKAIDSSSVDKEEIDMMVKEMTPQAINNVTVVVIEDDPDMMEQIKSELSTYFRVEAFMNGKTGYENIRQIKPALVISDIMLPGMSGYEIVSNLKADPETQDIPVIMLTAFDDANHILKAYKSFVDDYMVKPCNFKLLVARALQFVAADMKQKKSTHEKKIEAGKEVTTEAEKESTTEKAEKEMTTEKTIKIKPVKELKRMSLPSICLLSTRSLKIHWKPSWHSTSVTTVSMWINWLSCSTWAEPRFTTARRASWVYRLTCTSRTSDSASPPNCCSKANTPWQKSARKWDSLIPPISTNASRINMAWHQASMANKACLGACPFKEHGTTQIKREPWELRSTHGSLFLIY